MQQVGLLMIIIQKQLYIILVHLENYSSYIILNPKDYGIVVLANSYSKCSRTCTASQYTNGNGQHIKTLQYLINQWNILFIIITIILIAVASVFLIIYRLILNLSLFILKRCLVITHQNKYDAVNFTLVLAILHLLPTLLLSNSDWRFMMYAFTITSENNII